MGLNNPLPCGVERILGPAESRYFGTGHRSVRYSIAEVVAGLGTVTAIASITYPQDWSTKDPRRVLSPHLSSIDATLLGGVLCELDLYHRLGLSHRDRERAWLCGHSLRAGNRPLESLDAVELSASHVATQPGRVRELRSDYDVAIGSMRGRFVVEHDAPTGASPVVSYIGDPEAVIGPLDALTLLACRRRPEFHDVTVDLDGGRVSARVSIAPSDSAATGIGGRYQPAVTAVEAIVAAAQLTQVLLYSLDRIDRGSSETLWLRRIEQTCATPYLPTRLPLTTSVTITRSTLTELAGHTYRTVNVAYAMDGWTGRASVAHVIAPGDQPPRERSSVGADTRPAGGTP